MRRFFTITDASDYTTVITQQASPSSLWDAVTTDKEGNRIDGFNCDPQAVVYALWNHLSGNPQVKITAGEKD